MCIGSYCLTDQSESWFQAQGHWANVPQGPAYSMCEELWSLMQPISHEEDTVFQGPIRKKAHKANKRPNHWLVHTWLIAVSLEGGIWEMEERPE